MRLHVLLAGSLLAVALSSAGAGSPRRDSALRPFIAGREVSHVVVTAPIKVAFALTRRLPLPTYTVRPNRFVPVREDTDSVYFQAERAFAEGPGDLGGLCISKTSRDKIYVYRGDGRYPKIYLPFVGHVAAADESKVRFEFAATQTRK